MQINITINVPLATNVNKRDVVLKDVVTIGCSDEKIKKQVEEIKLCNFEVWDKTRSKCIDSVSISELIEGQVKGGSVSLVGEPIMMITYAPRIEQTFFRKFWEFCKIAFVCFSVFYGAAFTIMTFNSDVGIADVFELVYRFTGNKTDIKVLEISYSVGIFFGITLFYNHFSRKKNTTDPTPLEIGMSTYEQDVDTYKIKSRSDK